MKDKIIDAVAWGLCIAAYFGFMWVLISTELSY